MTGRRNRPTQRDIAVDTGLSMAAVSYALRGLRLPESTRQRVLESADRLGYHVNPIARALASGQTGTVGVLFSSLRDVWQQGLAATLGRQFLQEGLHALIVDATNDPATEARLSRRLVDHRVDALVVVPVDPHAAHWAGLATEVPIVAIGDGLWQARTAAEVVFDHDRAVSAALRLIADAGHRDLGVLTPGGMSTPDRPAELLVQRLGPTLGLRVRMVTCPADLPGAERVAGSLLDDPDRPTVMFCLADALAYGVYAAARSRGVAVPGQVSVVGYDDHPFSRLLQPPLTTLGWPVADLVQAVVAGTTRAIDDTRSRRTVLAPTVIDRGSLAAR